MSKPSLFKKLLEEFENDLDYKIEYKILEITEQICRMMDENDINRADLSRRLETSKSAVTKMLDGHTNFSLKRLIKIASALEKEVDIRFVEPIKESSKMDFNKPASSCFESVGIEFEGAGIIKENSDNAKHERLFA